MGRRVGGFRSGEGEGLGTSVGPSAGLAEGVTSLGTLGGSPANDRHPPRLNEEEQRRAATKHPAVQGYLDLVARLIADRLKSGR